MGDRRARLYGSVFRLTRLRVLALSGLCLATAIVVSIFQFAGAEGLLLPSGSNLGGDFLVFYAAGTAGLAGEAAAIYHPTEFSAMLSELGPEGGKGGGGLTWQYPPAYLLLVAPFALLAYVPAYILWTGAAAAAFIATMRAAGLREAVLFVIVAAMPTVHAAITGQNGFLTASLLAVAALYADKRPLWAGLAAALLTVKPQLGVLLPIAYLAGGCRRAFLTAAAGALALAALSVAAFGVEVWKAFPESILSASDNLAANRMPLYKMTTPFAAARLAGLPPEAAALIQAAFAAGAAAFVALVWRRVKDCELRAMALVACVLLATPYGYYYELVILALPAGLIAKRAMERGWLRYERFGLACAFALPLMLPGEAKHTGVAFGFLVPLVIASLVARRIAAEAPETFRLRTAPARAAKA